MKRLISRSRGFTLIELMVVMTIMSILAAIVVPAVGGTTTAGRGAVMNNDIQAIQGSVDRYVGDHPRGANGGYPISGGTLPASGTDVPLNWGASFVDPKEGTIKSFAKDYVKLSKPATDTTAFATTGTIGTISGTIAVTVTIPHSAAVRDATTAAGASPAGTLKDGELSYLISPSGIKPNITTPTTYSTAPDTTIGWAIQDVTTAGSEKYPVWRIDGGGNVKVNLKPTEY